MEQYLESTVSSVPMFSQKSPEAEEVTASIAQDVIVESCRDCASKNTVTSHQLPIPPASEPMQYRAIGLIHGTYVPSEEQFTRGTLMTEDDQPVDAVLLGRVMSLVKKHVDLTTPHLWVVYPRTRPKNEHLHAQIVGIWEPEKLHSDLDEEEQDTNEDAIATDGAEAAAEQKEAATLSDTTPDSENKPDDTPVSAPPDKLEAAQDQASSESDTNDASEDDQATDSTLVKPMRPKFSAAAVQAANTESAPAAEVSQPAAKGTTDPALAAQSAAEAMKDGYFSVRGEVLQFSPEDEQIMVRIRQISRKGSTNGKGKSSDEEKEFKLQLKGNLEGRAVGYFWDFQVQRQGRDLVVFDSNMIGIVPPRRTKRKKGPGGPRGGRPGMKRRFDGGRNEGRPVRSGERSPLPSPNRRSASSKPVLKKGGTSNPNGSSSGEE